MIGCSEMEMIRYGYALSSLVERAARLRQILKESLRPGDRLVIKTCNSLYTIVVLGGGDCLASGGWFDRRGLSPARVRINGCTWGGSAIKVDTAAAEGLCLEFANRLLTSPIQRAYLFPSESQN